MQDRRTGGGEGGGGGGGGAAAAAAKAVDEVDAERDRATPATSAALEAGVGGKVRSYAVVRRSTRRETERLERERESRRCAIARRASGSAQSIVRSLAPGRKIVQSSEDDARAVSDACLASTTPPNELSS
jgi:hypothetical protein